MSILYNLGELLKKAPLNYKAPRGTKYRVLCNVLVAPLRLQSAPI